MAGLAAALCSGVIIGALKKKQV